MTTSFSAVPGLNQDLDRYRANFEAPGQARGGKALSPMVAP